MKRWQFNIFAAFSLLLFVATAALWVRSNWVRGDDFCLLPSRSYYNIGLERRGTLIAVAICFPSSYLPPISNGFIDEPGNPEMGWIRCASFYGVQTASGLGWVRNSWGIAVLLPLWMNALVFALVPTVWLYRTLTQRAIMALLRVCPVCSYDLRAHKPGDRCPECGTPVPAKNEAKA